MLARKVMTIEIFQGIAVSLLSELFLIIIGLLSLVKRIIPGIWYYVKHLSWPIAFIVIGIAIIFISLKKR